MLIYQFFTGNVDLSRNFHVGNILYLQGRPRSVWAVSFIYGRQEKYLKGVLSFQHLSVSNSTIMPGLASTYAALTSLNLSNNAIQRLESIPPSLRHLDASHNLLRRISGLERNHSLTSLNLSHNALSRINGGRSKIARAIYHVFPPFLPIHAKFSRAWRCRNTHTHRVFVSLSLSSIFSSFALLSPSFALARTSAHMRPPVRTPAHTRIQTVSRKLSVRLPVPSVPPLSSTSLPTLLPPSLL